MKLTMRKLLKSIKQKSHNIVKSKEDIRQYFSFIRQKIKLPYVIGGAAIISGVVAGFFGFRYWRHHGNKNGFHLSKTNQKKLQEYKNSVITTAKSRQGVTYLLDGLAVISSLVSIVGITKRMFRK